MTTSDIRVDDVVLRVDDLVKSYARHATSIRRRHEVIQAVAGVSFTLRRGETLGLVGESGCGKSTTARTLLRLDEASGGQAYFEGESIFGMSASRSRAFRRQVQIVFQDPFESLNPRKTVAGIIRSAWKIHPGVVPKSEQPRRLVELLERVGLPAITAEQYPTQLSGGQRQRVGIARALALNPELIVFDEAVSALDVSVQAQVINLLQRLQTELGLTYLFIAHDLSVVRHISDRVAVMYLGKIVESGSTAQIFDEATHPYTQALLSAMPSTHPAQRGSRKRVMLAGDPPSPSDPPSGCRFRTRCWRAEGVCAEVAPPEVVVADGHAVACHFADELAGKVELRPGLRSNDSAPSA